MTMLQSLAPDLLGLILRSAALIAAGAIVAVLLRRQTAGLKHLALHCILWALLFLPIVECAAPPLRRPSAAFTRAEVAIFFNKPGAFAPRYQRPEATTISGRQARRSTWTPLVATLYLSVACILLLRLAWDLFRLRRVVSVGEAIPEPGFGNLEDQIWSQLFSRRRPRILASKNVHFPVTLGIVQSTILLPFSWTLWSRDKLQAALIHEIAHVHRNDSRTAILASLAVCLFWPNPLVYWLRRQLAALAEEACDEAALSCLEPHRYARILIDFATEAAREGRLLSAGSPMAARRRIAKRLQNVFSIHPGVRRTHPLLRALLIAVSIPALYIAASTRLDQQISVPVNLSVENEQQARTLESELARNPEDMKVRSALLVFYANERNEAAFTRQMLWVINHRPEAPVAVIKFYAAPGTQTDKNVSEQDHQLIHAAWETALAVHPENPDVLFHAGLFLETDDPERALQLLHHAAGLSPADATAQKNYLRAISSIYAAAVVEDLNPAAHIGGIGMTPDLARELHNEIADSSDPALLSETGTILAHLGQKDAGSSLMQQAIDIDPANQRWKQALESAKAKPFTRQNMLELMAGQNGPVVRAGAAVAAAKLVSKVEPKYPPLALKARITGTVEFMALIDKDGKVRSLRLIRGHPLLVNAAKDAVLRYVYHPTLLNGKPVAVATLVDVTFKLSQ